MNEHARLVRSASLAPAPYAHAALVAAGVRLVLAAGACPLDERGALVGAGDVAAQAEQVMVNLTTALADAGASLAEVVRTTVYVASADRPDLVAVWQVVHTVFAPHDPPSTLLGVTVLGHSGQLVEVDAIAALPG